MFDAGRESDFVNSAGVELAPRVRVPASALRIQFSRSGGPGGQNVNKLNTKAELWIALHDLSPRLTHRAIRTSEPAARQVAVSTR